VSPVRYEVDFYIPEDDRSYARFGAYPNIYKKTVKKLYP
jgi:hypothetical protein